MPRCNETSRDCPGSLWAEAVLLFVLLAAIYLASYSGLFHSIDELPIVALAQNLAQQGGLDINQLVWAQDSTPNSLGDYGLDDNLYSKHGLGMTLAALPLYWAGQRLPGVGAAQAALLTNNLVTALTAVLLFLYVVELDYRPGTGLLVALAYGLGTIAWVYSRYLFTEPLAALGLTGTAFFLLRHRNRASAWDSALAGAALGLTVLTRAEYLLALPLFLAYAWYPFPKRRALAISLVPFLLSLSLAGAAILLYNRLRFGSFLETGYSSELIFSTPLLEGLGGLLFSPGRSIFLYCPVVLAGIGGIFPLLKAQRREGRLIATLSLGFLLFYSAWHSWHGGWSWGPRLLLPITPLLLIPLAPLWQRARAAGFGAVVGLSLLVGLSAAVQIPGVAVDFSLYLKGLMAADLSQWAPILDPRYTPLVGHLRLLWQGAVDLAWARGGAVLWALLLPPVGLALAAAWGMLTARWRPVLPLALLLALPVLCWWTLQANHPEADFSEAKMNRQAIDYLGVAAGPGDVLLVDFRPFSPLSESTIFFLNHYHNQAPYYAWVRTGDPRGGTLERREKVLQSICGRYGRAWLLLPGTLQGDASSTTEKWLAEHAFKSRHEWFDSSTRLALYSLPSPGSAPQQQTVGADFGPAISLRSYYVALRGPGDSRRQGQNAPYRAFPGDALQVALFWQSRAQIGFDLVVFLQLLDEKGEMRLGHDSRPVDDMWPTKSWQAGEEIEDHHALLLPSDFPPGTYRLVAGLYDPVSQRRAPVSGEKGGDMVTLAEIEVGR